MCLLEPNETNLCMFVLVQVDFMVRMQLSSKQNLCILSTKIIGHNSKRGTESHHFITFVFYKYIVDMINIIQTSKNFKEV